MTHWKRLWCWEGLGAGGEGTTEDEMAGWNHWLDGRESEWTPGVGDGGLACCDSWGHKESDTTEQLNWTEPYINGIENMQYVQQIINGFSSRTFFHFFILNRARRSYFPQVAKILAFLLKTSSHSFIIFAKLSLTSVTKFISKKESLYVVCCILHTQKKKRKEKRKTLKAPNNKTQFQFIREHICLVKI